jgi:ATP-dependent DNA helicase RecG
MATPHELRARLRRPLERELATGCQDGVVLGGLERMLATLGRPLDDVATLLAGYASWTPERRRRAVEAALRRLEPADGAGAATLRAPRRARAARPVRT